MYKRAHCEGCISDGPGLYVAERSDMDNAAMSTSFSNKTRKHSSISIWTKGGIFLFINEK